MLKKILFISLILTSVFANAQLDSIPKKDTIQAVIINKLAVKKDSQLVSAPVPSLGEIFRPKISLGVGMLSFHGDLYSKHFQAPWTARIGYDLNFSQRLFKSVQLNFNILFGKLGANEWLNNRQENFQSEIRSGGISVLYDFSNLISEYHRVRPWISLGVNSIEFLSKTDAYDQYGNKYYYWSDGSLKNIAETAPTASLAVNLNRDYYYETDIRELNKDGFGRYQERAWSFPIGIGTLVKITDRFDVKLGVQYYFTTTDYIDGITNKSKGTRAGTNQKDNFVYSSFSLQYDLYFKKTSKSDTLPDGYFDNVDWLAVDDGDYDEDGVKDFDDKCQGTPKGEKIDEFGCPFDDDQDGVPNYADEELESPTGVDVNIKGVALTDEYWQNWYNQYMDSGYVAPTEVIENFYTAKKDSTNSKKINKPIDDKLYTVELVRYNGPIPNDEMAYLLSIGDIESTVLPDNQTVMYTAGSYKEILNAIKRRDEFLSEGVSSAKVGYFKNGNIVHLSDEELKKLNQLETEKNASSPNGTSKEESENNENEFAKGDIVYRVQLGAYKNRISKEIFKNAGTVIELKTDDNYFHYASTGYKSIENAAHSKADLVLEGYSDAFITAYKDGKRIPMSATKATMETNEKENIDKIESFSSIDKSLVSFKIQLGALRKANAPDVEEKMKEIEGLEKQTTSSGMIRYTVGLFNNYEKADTYLQELANKGFYEAFVIAIFKGEIISIEEAKELLK